LRFQFPFIFGRENARAAKTGGSHHAIVVSGDPLAIAAACRHKLRVMTDAIAAKYAHLEDPGIRQFLIAGERFYPADAVTFSLAEQRAFYDRYCAHFRTSPPRGVTTEDFQVGSIPCRLYRTNASENPPVLLYLHGGSFVLGGLESHDDVCAELCDGADVAVAAVEYRLAPEQPFPAAFDDCWSVLTHLATSGWRKIAVGGDSAGGNLAAALSLKARDAGGPRLMGQILIYPGLGGDMSKGSYVTQANAPGLTTKDVEYYHHIYKGGDSKYASPLRETHYENLPPAFLVAAGLDPLHDDCDAYAQRLHGAGVAAIVRHEPLLVHAFLRARRMSEPAADSFRAIADAVFSLAWHGELPEQDEDPR
jgi:acetyl esterase